MIFAFVAIVIAASIGVPLFGDSQEANNAHDDAHDDDTPPPYTGVRTEDGSSPPPPDTPKDEMLLSSSFYPSIKGLSEDEASQLKRRLSPSPTRIDPTFRNLVRGLMNQRLLPIDEAAKLEKESQEAKESFERASETHSDTQKLNYAAAYNFEKLDRNPFPPYVYGAAILVGMLASSTSMLLCGSPVKTVKDLAVNFCVGAPGAFAALILVPAINHGYALYSKQTTQAEEEQTRQKMTTAKKAMVETKDRFLRDLAVHLFELTFRGYMKSAELEVNPDRIISSLVADKEMTLSQTDLVSVKCMYQVMCLIYEMDKTETTMGLLMKAASSKKTALFPLDPKMCTLPKRFNGRDVDIDPSKIRSVYLALLLIDDGVNQNPLPYINALMLGAIMYKTVDMIEWMGEVNYLPESYKQSALLDIALAPSLFI